MKFLREIGKGCCLSPIILTCTTNSISSKLSKGLATSKYEDKYVFRSEKYDNVLVLVAKEETVLQNMTDG